MLGLESSSDHLRKTAYGFYEAYKYLQEKNVPTDKLVEIQKERCKLQAEKIELNKLFREQSRYELFEEKLAQSIEKFRNIKIPIPIKKVENQKAGILTIADCHYGKKLKITGLHNEIMNIYDTEIFEKRMWDLYSKILIIADKENLTHINIFNLSDSLEGMIRITQLQSLELGVTDSIIGFADFMSVWLNKLSKDLTIDYYSVQGNHNESRPFGSKKGDFPKENSERIITWHLNTVLKDNQNITIHYNTPNCYTEILGIKILAVHGQMEKNLEQSIKDYSALYGEQIDLLLTGHLHSGAEKTVASTGIGNMEVIQSPSIMGVDDYALSLKKSSKAGTKFLILEENVGKSVTYDIKLN